MGGWPGEGGVGVILNQSLEFFYTECTNDGITIEPGV